MRLYSQSTGNCYLADVHKVIPADAVEISDELYDAVIANPKPGKIRAHDEQGLPYLTDPPPATSEELETLERTWRDAELVRTEWLTTRHRDEQELGRETTLTADQYAELLTYRQALRDWPEAEAFPDATRRPAAPAWLEAALTG